MNDRIKEIVDQAKKSVPAGLEPEKWLDVYHEKFAELIIRECDQYARSTWEHGHLLGGDLKRLFGFEE